MTIVFIKYLSYINAEYQITYLMLYNIEFLTHYKTCAISYFKLELCKSNLY